MRIESRKKGVEVLLAFIILFIWVKISVVKIDTWDRSPDDSEISQERGIISHFNKTLVDPGVILHVKGGIGNQLFQYACSYALARERVLPLYQFIVRKSNDTSSFFQTNRKFQPNQREFSLDSFQIPLNHFIDKTTVINGSKVTYIDDAQLYDKTFKENTFLQLSGGAYCQSIEYWKKYKDDIRTMFELKSSVIGAFPLFVHKFRDLIESTPESVAVHVRRGDFMRVTGYEVPISYQRSAIRRLTKILHQNGNVNPPTFFVFSDDAEYVRRMLQDMPTSYKFVYMSTSNSDGIQRTTTSLQDFYLMTKCKHFIIPNSTFSWWAAFLGTTGSGNAKNRIVIASTFNPKFWGLFAKNQAIKQFYKILHGRMYHLKEWIIINPFIGEGEA